MRIALVNPAWDISEIPRLGWPHHHPPLELLYAHEMLLLRGVESRVLDAGASCWDQERLVSELIRFAPTDVFFTTAPGYVFWRSAPRHLEVPAGFCRLARLADLQTNLICVGPHVSVAPEETLFSLLCDAAVIGEPEEVIAAYQGAFRGCSHFAYFKDGELVLPPGPAQTAVEKLPALSWRDYPLGRLGGHPEHGPAGPATDIEFSRGWPPGLGRCYLPFRSRYRERAAEQVLEELGRLRERGVGYVCFIDEIFGLGGAGRLLRQMAAGDYPRFGARSRIDIWANAEALDLLTGAGCASLELEVEVRSGKGPGQAEGGPTLLERAEETLSLAARRLDLVEVRLLVPPAAAERETLPLWRGRLGRFASRLVEEAAPGAPPVQGLPGAARPWRRGLGRPEGATS